MKRQLPFDKYDLYRRSVQSAEGDVRFMRDIYKKISKKTPVTLREDFCGTAALSTEWVKMGPGFKAVGFDLDPEPLVYGLKNYVAALKPEQQKRVALHRKNVMSKGLPKADILAALNFSYFLFKTRPQMLEYCQNMHRGLKPKGIAIMDAFGGSQCQDAITDRTRHKGFTYFWEQKNLDPVSCGAQFAIHFQVNGRKYKDVFTYDWRMWGIPELRDVLHEAGFKKVSVYWEGTSRDGGGSGNFYAVEKGEPCLSWICYLVAQK